MIPGLPPEQVVERCGRLLLKMRDSEPVIVRLRVLNFIDDKAGKPVGISSHIGRRPIAAFGGSEKERLDGRE